MKRLILSITLLISFTTIIFGQAIGEWRVHLSYYEPTLCVPANHLIYTLCQGGLFSYDTEDNSVFTYDKNNYLNDNNIAGIAYSKDYKTLIIVYENSNIDLLVNDQEVYNISDFMNASIIEDKTLQSISINDEYAYLSTNFGIVIVNLKKKEITNTYKFGERVNSAIKINDNIYAATQEKVYIGNIKDNLLDFNNWSPANQAHESTRIKKLLYFDNSLLAIASDTIYKYNSSNNTFETSEIGSYSFIDLTNNQLILGNASTIKIYNNLQNDKITINHANDFSSLSLSNNIYWAASNKKGVEGYKYNSTNNQLDLVTPGIIPDSPRRNLAYYLTYTDRLLVAGGDIWWDRQENPGTIIEYKDHNWDYFEEGENISNITNFPYLDIVAVIQDPKDPEHVFAAAGGEGIYEFQNKKFIKLHNQHNSTLEGFKSSDRYVRMSGMQYDKQGNLWALNSVATRSAIKILTNDNKWTELIYPTITKKETLGDILFDRNNLVWIVNKKQDPEIICIDINNNIFDTSKHTVITRKKFINQDGKTVDPLYYYCIAEDRKGAIWIGSNKGPLIINDPTKIFDTNFYCTQIKVPRNDGTNNADLLLENESVRAICIDGANRKWIGTENSGVYLLSEDGLETIHHFTTDNSSLISNFINSIAINPNNGEVFIGTDKGLVSYRSDATEAQDTFSKDAYAFPNPVSPDYQGVITVTGLLKDSNVKITDSNGSLIHEGTSLGGQFSWNGKNRSGKRVASGVYFVIAANEEGKEGIITKIVMIK